MEKELNDVIRKIQFANLDKMSPEEIAVWKEEVCTPLISIQASLQ